jgi:hypothetical protein
MATNPYVGSPCMLGVGAGGDRPGIGWKQPWGITRHSARLRGKADRSEAAVNRTA